MFDLYNGYSFAEEIRFKEIRRQVELEEKIKKVKDYGKC